MGELAIGCGWGRLGGKEECEVMALMVVVATLKSPYSSKCVCVCACETVNRGLVTKICGFHSIATNEPFSEPGSHSQIINK